MPVFEQMDKNLQPRERLENAESILALSDKELLCLIIRIGRTGRNAVEVGRELKDAFGSVRNMVYADWREIAHAGVQGVGKVKAMELAAAFELARRGAKLTAEDYAKPVTEVRLVFEHVRALGGRATGNISSPSTSIRSGACCVRRKSSRRVWRTFRSSIRGSSSRTPSAGARLRCTWPTTIRAGTQPLPGRTRN